MEAKGIKHINKKPIEKNLSVSNNKKETPNLHQELVNIASKWLKKHTENIKVPNCPHILNETVTNNITREIPDIIGWCSWTSILIEVKVSKSDYLADSKKPFRQEPETGMGEFRYYLCPANMILEDELPKKWGLLYIDEKNKIEIIKVAERQKANLICERTMLVNLLRRNK